MLFKILLEKVVLKMSATHGQIITIILILSFNKNLFQSQNVFSSKCYSSYFHTTYTTIISSCFSLFVFYFPFFQSNFQIFKEFRENVELSSNF